MAAHSLSAVHPRQVFVESSQMGVALEQVLLSMYCTHAPVLAHAGAVLLLAAHWAGVMHAAHTWFAQMGVVPEHPALFKHATHLFVVVSQKGVASEQVLLPMHCTQAPVSAHAGAALSLPAHWAVVVQAAQVLLAAQMGVVPPHVLLSVHCTHLFVAVSHAGVLPPQSVFAAH